MPAETESLGGEASQGVKRSVAVAHGGRARVLSRFEGVYGCLGEPYHSLNAVYIRVDGVNKLRFGAKPSRDVHAVDPARGTVVARQARKLESEAELDDTKLSDNVDERRLLEVWFLAIFKQ